MPVSRPKIAPPRPNDYPATKERDDMFKNLTERDLVWAWRIMVLICAIFTACSASYVASSVMVAQYRIWQMGG